MKMGEDADEKMDVKGVEEKRTGIGHEADVMGANDGEDDKADDQTDVTGAEEEQTERTEEEDVGTERKEEKRETDALRKWSDERRSERRRAQIADADQK